MLPADTFPMRRASCDLQPASSCFIGRTRGADLALPRLSLDERRRSSLERPMSSRILASSSVAEHPSAADIIARIPHELRDAVLEKKWWKEDLMRQRAVLEKTFASEVAAEGLPEVQRKRTGTGQHDLRSPFAQPFAEPGTSSEADNDEPELAQSVEERAPAMASQRSQPLPSTVRRSSKAKFGVTVSSRGSRRRRVTTARSMSLRRAPTLVSRLAAGSPDMQQGEAGAEARDMAFVQQKESVLDNPDNKLPGLRLAKGGEHESGCCKILLTRAEEVYLGDIVRKWADVRAAKESLRKSLQREATAEEVAAKMKLRSAEAVSAAESTGLRARQIFFRFNQRLVYQLCHNSSSQGVPMSSLHQAGCQGLMKAVDRFDGSKGFKFSTYAHWWIRQAITRCVFEESRVIRLPVHVNEALWRISRVKQQLSSQQTSPPTTAQIAAACNLSEDKVIEYQWMGRPTRNMDDPVHTSLGSNSDGPLTCGDLLIDDTHSESMAAEEARATEEVIKEDLAAVLATLPPRERNVLKWRYGLHTSDRTKTRPLTLAEISNAYGLTVERIRQIEDMALTKLKLPWRQALLRPHLYFPSSTRGRDLMSDVYSPA